MTDFGISMLSGVVANVVYNGLNKGMSLTKSYLVGELTKQISEDEDKLKLLAEKIIEINKEQNLEKLSEKYIKQEIESSKELVEVLQRLDAQKIDQKIIQTHSGTGDNIVGIKNS